MTTESKKKSFVECLDLFKEKPDLNYYDLLNIFHDFTMTIEDTAN